MKTSGLLESLDALVREDAAPSGFAATLAFAVRIDGDTRWWRVTCGARAQGAFVDEPGPCDASLLMGEAEARAIVAEGRVPDDARLLRASGERALLERFVRRYVTVRRAWDRG